MELMQAVMREMNSNMAGEKPLLSEMMDGKNSYRMRDGTEVEVPHEQLQYLWDLCNDEEKLRLRLPIYVSTDVSTEVSAWKVEGKAEAAVVARILGKSVRREGFLRMYHPDLKDLKKTIPDCFLVVFTP